jgi:hypothetical protein
MTERDLNPGSPEAVEQGCTCPVTDNDFCAGIRSTIGVVVWLTSGCPLHSVFVTTNGGRDD